MLKQALIIVQVRVSLTYNKIISYLQKIPLIGRIVPDSLYRIEFSKAAFALVSIFTILKQLLFKLLYLGFLFLLGLGVYEDGVGPSALANYLLFIFCFSLIAGLGLQEPNFNPASVEDPLFIRLYGLPAKNYFLAKNLLALLEFALPYGFWLFLSLSLQGVSPFKTLAFFSLILGTRILNIALTPYYKLEERKWLGRIVGFFHVLLIGLGVGLALAYALGHIYFEVELALSPLAGLLGLALAALGIFLAQRCPHYAQLAKETLTPEKISSIQNRLENPALANVSLSQEEESLAYAQFNVESAQNLEGLTYVNELFFARLGHILRKDVRRKLRTVSILSLGVFGFLLFLSWQASGQPPIDLARLEIAFRGPVVLGILYYSLVFSLGVKYDQFCFYHMDRYLLKLNFYREPEHVLTSLKIRLKKLLLYNLPILLVCLLLFNGAYLVLGGRFIETIGFISLACVVAMLFYSLHYLYTYFIFQPYTESMDNQSTPYALATGLAAYLPYFLTNLTRDSELNFMHILLIAVLIYLVLGLFLVFMFAPKTFKLK